MRTVWNKHKSLTVCHRILLSIRLCASHPNRLAICSLSRTKKPKSTNKQTDKKKTVEYDKKPSLSHSSHPRKTNMRRISKRDELILWASAIIGFVAKMGWTLRSMLQMVSSGGESLTLCRARIVQTRSVSGATGSKWDSVDRYDGCYLMCALSSSLSLSVCASRWKMASIEVRFEQTNGKQNEHNGRIREWWIRVMVNERVFHSILLVAHIVHRYIVFDGSGTGIVRCSNILRVNFFSFDRWCARFGA